MRTETTDVKDFLFAYDLLLQFVPRNCLYAVNMYSCKNECQL